MLRQVDVTNKMAGGLALPLGQLTNTGLILTAITGLDPTQATISLSDYALQDGGCFHSARRESRNILMGFTLDSRYGGLSTRQLREVLYRVFMPKTQVALRFYLEGDLEVTIDGVVESIQTPMFTKDPGAVVSILCPTPDFTDTKIISGTGEGFSTHNWFDIPYTGSSPSGIDFEIEVNASATSNGFSIHLRRPDGEIEVLQFRAPLQGGDNVVINSHPGRRSADLTRSGVTTSIMSGITPNSKWPSLRTTSTTRTNRFSVLTNGGQFYYEYSYQRKFGGI